MNAAAATVGQKNIIRLPESFHFIQKMKMTFQQTAATFLLGLCLAGVAQAQLEAHCIMDGTNGVGES